MTRQCEPALRATPAPRRKRRRIPARGVQPVVAALTTLALAGEAEARTWTVCAEANGATSCDFVSFDGLQQAVDTAADGDRLRLNAGRFRGNAYRDVEFDGLVIRGRVLVEGKSLVLEGQPGTVLDLGTGTPASAIVVHGGEVTLRGLTVENARPALAEDDVYDGHGVFVVDAAATLEDVTFRRIEKMALSVRGDSRVQARGVRMLDGHVGVWIEEAAGLELADCVMARNDSAAVAAYARARVTVTNCTVEANEDDGLYAAETAAIDASEVLFVRNRPYAVRAVDDARITVAGGVFYANAAERSPAERSPAEGDSEPANAVDIRSSHTFPAHCSFHEERQAEAAPSSCSQ